MAAKKKTTKNKSAKKAKPAKKAKVSKKPAKKVKKGTKPKKAVRKVVKKAVKKTVKKTAKKHIKKTAVKKIKSPVRSKKSSSFARFTDKELNEFKKMISEKLIEAKRQLQEYQDQITRKDEHGTDDTENRFVSMEDGTSTIEREIASQMAARTRQYVDNLEKALARIQNKTYGICMITGKLISKERLYANPIATKTIEAKNQEKKTQQIQPGNVYQIQQPQEQESELE